VPLLKRGPEIFPQALFELNESDTPWFVAHTRSRQEKALARHLLPLEIPFYLPVSENVVHRRGRTLTSYLPLFPGYVFLRGSSAERVAALRSNLIVRVLEVREQDVLARELRDLRSLQLAGASLEPAHAYAPGDAVVVSEGPFRGYRGTVLQEKGRLRLIVSVSMLHQSVAVELDRASIVPVSERRFVRSASVA
jgi:transcription antitermination factor NusG